MEGIVTRVKMMPKLPKLNRVAAYARVSSGKDAMLHSLSAQVDYYTEYIKSRAEWEFVEVYTDEGISALNTKKGTDGLPEIVESEAEIVCSIYRMFMEGMSTNAIAKHLTDVGIPTPSKKSKWQRQTVESILTNEKYKGSALLQKKYTVDFFRRR